MLTWAKVGLVALAAQPALAASIPKYSVGVDPRSASKVIEPRASSEQQNYTYSIVNCTGYSVTNVQESQSGVVADLELRQGCSAFGTDIKELVLNVTYSTKERLNVHIYDKAEEQWQIPNWLIPRPEESVSSSQETDLAFNYTNDPFEWWITRRSDGDVLFDTRNASMPAPFTEVIPPSDLGLSQFTDSLSYHNNTAMPAFPFVFEDQYIQVSSAVPDDANIYGLGQVVASSGFRRNNTATLQINWDADRGDAADSNIYGSFPFYVEHRINNGTSSSHGVYLHSSEGMEILLRTGVIEYRIIGGTLDLTFYSGPTPTEVVQQHGKIAGHSQLPPLFALGFNLCRWGYENITQTREVVTKMKDAGIPLETMWNDIDWMDAYRDFVPAPNRFAADEYGAFVDELHANNQHYVMIIDAAINLELNSSDVYYPYSKGNELDVFMKNPDGSQYIGQVWPGATAFPDWFANNTQAWWTEAFTNFSEIVQFDGVWLDMNEVSSFCLGSCFSVPGANISNTSTPFLLSGSPGAEVTTYPEGYNSTLSGTSGNLTINGSLTYQSTVFAPVARRSLETRDFEGQAEETEKDITSPPYLLHNAQDYANLGTHAVSPNATHANGVVELDVHNIWGYMEEKATHASFNTIYPGKRPYLISRSTFTGSGIYTGAWGGDNSATWAELQRSIQVILGFQLNHIGLIGVDSCGFNGNTDEELCNRWMQLGAFSPFYRNHNVRGAISQEPYVWDSVAEASRVAIKARYELLPYWYTRFAHSYFNGTPIVNALIFAFPTDASLVSVSDQYLVGDDILVTSVITPNTSSVVGRFPDAGNTLWRDWWTHEVVNSSTPASGSQAANVTLDAPLGHIPVHIRSGSVLLLYNEAKYTVAETKGAGYGLLASLSPNGTATGMGYIDDGESYPVQTDGDWVTFNATNTTLVGSAGSGSKNTSVVGSELRKVTVLGVSAEPTSVVFNEASISNFTFNATVQRLVVDGLYEPLVNGFKLSWS